MIKIPCRDLELF